MAQTNIWCDHFGLKMIEIEIKLYQINIENNDDYKIILKGNMQVDLSKFMVNDATLDSKFSP